MKILLVALNAKYPQTNPAVRILKQVLNEAFGGLHDVVVREFSINQPKAFILSEIYNERPHIAAFSVYIWNVSMLSGLISDLKKVLDTIVITGGPEILDGDDIDITVIGEGETVIADIVSDIENNTYASRYEASCTESLPPFAYEDFSLLEHRAIYYESSRGCPNRCAYCVSGGTKFRLRDLEETFCDLRKFLAAGLKRVKFLDRTFNADRNYAYRVWEFLIQNNNGVTRFHFEIMADLLDEKSLTLLSSAPTGLFQFEIGIQSVNIETLKAISRKTNLEETFGNIKSLTQAKNIHIHLDLIAGLPYEDLESFKVSFNTVFNLNPDVLQLGFLKLLKGTRLKENAESFGIIYSESPPYEVLSTKWLSYNDLILLKDIDKVFDLYFNSKRFTSIVSSLNNFFKTPFDFFEALAKFFKANRYSENPHSVDRQHEILLEFANAHSISLEKIL